MRKTIESFKIHECRHKQIESLYHILRQKNSILSMSIVLKGSYKFNFVSIEIPDTIRYWK